MTRRPAHAAGRLGAPALVGAVLLSTACASGATGTGAPPATPVPAPARATGVPVEATPAFRAGPLVVWGAPPPGTPHGERARSYDLQHQVVRVTFDWRRHAVVGETTLKLAALDSAISDVALDAVGMSALGARGANGAALRHDYDGRTLVVHLASPLAAHAATSIVVRYEAVRPKKGAYFIDRRHVVWTQGETEDTRYWVPTYDYPNDKTTWEIYVRTAANEKALSNGRLVEQRKVGAEVEWHWAQERPASTYLMTAVTGDFVVLQDRWKDVSIGYWTYPDSVRAAWRGFGRTPRAVDVFARKTGVDYPWAKYDQVVAPDYIFGGMENVSATTQADDAILHPAWAEPQANADDLVSHELGHQWYGDLLTTRDWSHVWLNEGFATFMEQTFREADKGADEGALARLLAQREVIDADARARRPLVYDRWVTDPLELFFSGHIYPKGATVLQSLRHQLGDSLFWRAMKRYTTEHSYGTVVSADLERAFTQTAGRDFAPFFRQWVYGAGYPAFRVSYAYDAASRRLALTAEQVQPRDSLTGLFDADVDVEVLTDRGPVRGVVPVRGASTGDPVTRFALTLPDAPRSIRWDEGGWLLDVTDFPRPTAMLAHQLAHDGDPIGRIEAAELLAERARSPGAAADAAVDALARAARGDAFWAVRRSATDALGAVAADSALAADSAERPARGRARDALLAASRDADPRVRESAATAMAAFAPVVPVAPLTTAAPGAAAALRARWAEVAARLRELATGDSSLYVRGTAMESYAVVAPDSALPLARTILARDSWTDIERSHALTALGGVDRPGVVELLSGYLGPAASRSARLAALDALVRRAAGREGEVARAVAPLLEASDIFVRIAAAGALGRLRQPASAAALRARRRVEPESRVLNAIDAALEAVGGA